LRVLARLLTQTFVRLEQMAVRRPRVCGSAVLSGELELGSSFVIQLGC
jgi:hypothetical protein